MLVNFSGAVTALKRRIEDHNLETIQLKRQHTNEVSRLTTEMREKNEADRARLLNQIRELTQMTEEKNFKVFYSLWFVTSITVCVKAE